MPQHNQDRLAWGQLYRELHKLAEGIRAKETAANGEAYQGLTPPATEGTEQTEVTRLGDSTPTGPAGQK